MGSRSLTQSEPLGGRCLLIDAVLAALATGAGVVVAGPSGIGKSHLVGQIFDRLTAEGILVRRVVGSPAATPVPLAALSGLLGGATAGDLIGAAMTALGGPTERTATADLPVLIIDDADTLDEPSAVVVHQLATSGRVRILATVRSTAGGPTPIARLAVAAHTHRFDVGPIDHLDAQQMLGVLVGGHIETSALAQLIERSEGNPLHLRELVRGSIESGSLRRHGTVWRLVAPLRPSSLLRELLMARLAPLDPAALDALELLAVAGRIDTSLAAVLVSEDGLESLERSELIVVRTDGTAMSVDVAQANLRDLLNESIGALRRMRIYRTLAQASPDSGATDAAELQSVVWHLRGGVNTDGRRMTKAARTAMQANDTPLGAELAQAAARISGELEPVLIGCWCLSQLGRHDEAIADAERALATSTDPWSSAVLHHRIAEELWWFRHDLDRAQWHVSDAVGLPAGPWHGVLQAQRGVFAMLDGHLDDAVRLCAPLSDAPQLGVRFIASLGHALALAHLDRADEAVVLAEQTFRLSSSASDAERLSSEPGIHLICQLVGLIYAGRYGEAAAAAEFVHGVALSLPGSQPRGWAATVRGFAALLSGEPAAATRWFTEAEAHWVDAGLPGLARWVSGGLSLAQSAIGDREAAAATMERIDTYEIGGFRLYQPIEELARVWLAVADGDDRSAALAAKQAIDLAERSGASALLGQIAHDLARLDLRLAAGQALDALDRIGDRGAEPRGAVEPSRAAVPSRVLHARRRFVEARLADDPDQLVVAGDLWEALGAPLFAAEAQTLAAASYRKRGKARQHIIATGRAGTLLAACGPVATPPLAGRSSAGPLSARELHIAELAGSGMSSKEIADRLIIGERTVESHLYRIFLKLGVASRDEIEPALARLGMPAKR